MTYSAGRHFLQIPGPTNVPDRVLRAIDRATIDHRPEFAGTVQRPQGCIQNEVSCRHLPGFRNRRVGSGACEYPLAGRPGTHV